MSGLDTHTHTHTHTQDDYSNPRCACAPRVNNHSLSYASQDGFTPLITASFEGHVEIEIVRILIEAKALLNVQAKVVCYLYSCWKVVLWYYFLPSNLLHLT